MSHKAYWERGRLVFMTVEKIIREHETIIKLSGAIDTPVAQSFMSAVEDCRKDNPRKIVFDFADVPYISSSGLGILLKAKKITDGKGGQVLIKHPSETIIGILDTVGFLPLFTIQE